MFSKVVVSLLHKTVVEKKRMVIALGLLWGKPWRLDNLLKDEAICIMGPAFTFLSESEKKTLQNTQQTITIFE